MVSHLQPHRLNASEHRFLRIFRILPLLCLLLAFTGGAVAATPPSGANRVWPHAISDLEPAPELIFGTLDNGIRYVLMPNGKPEDRVSMHLSISTGSFNETPDQRGIAHFLEHMLFSGSENFEPGEMIKFFQRIGMRFGPDVNARTGFYETVYDLDLPAGNRATLAEGVLILRDYAAGGLIPADKVTEERSVILAEKRTRDSPDYRTFESTLAFEMPDARIASRLPIGIEEVIRTTDRPLLKTFYDTWYRPENMTVIMVGEFDPETAVELIEGRFSDIAPRAPAKPVPDFGTINHQGIRPFYHHEPEAGSTRVTIEVITKEAMPPDSASYQREQLLLGMADQIVQYRLNELLDRPGAPFISASTGSGHYLKFIRAAEISAECAQENWENTLGVIEQNLRKALTFGFTQAEVHRAKKEFSAMLERAVRSAPTRESVSLAGQILNHLEQDRVFQSPAQRQKLLETTVQSATPQMLHELYKSAWRPDHRLILVTGNADLATGKTVPDKKIADVFEASRKRAVEKPVEAGELKFPYLPVPSAPVKIKTREYMEDLGVTRVVFENGTVLFVKKTDFKTDEVMATLGFGHGESSEPAEMPGLSEMSQQVINSSGLGGLDRDQLRQVLAGKNTGVGFSVEEDKFVFTGMSVTDETRLLFELFHAHLTDPGYREAAHQLAVRQFSQEYLALSHSVEGALQLEGRQFLAGGDTRFGLPPLESIKKTGIDAIRQWVGGAMQSSPLEIAVVGDMDPEEIIELAGTYFGTLPARSTAGSPDAVRLPDFPEKGSLQLHVPTRIQKGLILISYPTTGIWNIHDTRRLSILSEIFSDRMRIEVREKLGASYSQVAYNNPSRAYPDYGLFTTYVIIDPEDVKPVERAIRDIAADLGKNGTTRDELDRALKPMLTGIKQSLKTNEYWLHTVLKGAGRNPVQLEWSRTIQDDYASISLEEINAMADNYLNNMEAATVLIRPVIMKEEPGTAAP